MVKPLGITTTSKLNFYYIVYDFDVKSFFNGKVIGGLQKCNKINLRRVRCQISNHKVGKL